MRGDGYRHTIFYADIMAAVRCLSVAGVIHSVRAARRRVAKRPINALGMSANFA